MPQQPGITVVVVETHTKHCASALDLAASFGGQIFEPAWWPDDAGAVDYSLDESPSRVGYRIGSIRRDGAPISLIGRTGEQPEQTLPPGDWSRSLELEAWRGLVRVNGATIHAVLYAEQQTIHMIGDASESEVVQAARSLRPVTAE